MRAVRFGWARAASHRLGLGLGLLALAVGAAAFAVVVVLGSAASSEADAVTGTLKTSPRALSLVISTAPASDVAAQDAAVSRLVRARLPVPVTVTAATTAGPLVASHGRAAGQALLIGSDRQLLRGVRITAGDGSGALVDSAGARSLGLGVGGILTLADGDGAERRVRMTGLWSERDPTSPLWSALGPGAQSSSVRLLVGPALLDGAGPTRQWSVTPVRLTPGDLAAVQTGLTALPAAAEADPAVTASSVDAAGDGSATIAAMRQAIAGADALLPGAVAALGITAAIAVLLLAGIVAEVRERETRLLLARGASPRALVAMAAGEGAAVALVGSVVGTAAGIAALALAGRRPDWTGALFPPLAVAAGALAALIVVAVRAVTAARGRTAARRPASVAVPSVLLAAAAAIATWRFLTAEVPGAPPDPVGVLAPALLLGTASVGALLLVRPLAAVAARRLARGRTLVPTLAARHLGRAHGPLTGVVAAVAPASGAVAATGGLLGTWSDYTARGALVANGAEVRADYGAPEAAGSTASLLPLAAARRTRGVRSAVLAMSGSGSVLGSPVAIEAVPVAALSSAAQEGPAEQGLTERDPGLPLPAGTDGLRMALGDTSAAVAPTVWLQDPDGDVVSRVLGAVRRGVGDLPLALPAGTWRIVAVDFRTALPPGATAVATITATLRGSDATAVRAHWVVSAAASIGSGAPLTGGLGVRLSPPEQQATGETVTAVVRLVPSAPPAPVVVSAAAAATLAVRTGTTVAVEDEQGAFLATVRRVVPVVPGTDGGAAIAGDLGALERAGLAGSAGLPAPDVILVATSAPAAVAADLADGPGTPTTTVADAAFPHRFVDGTADGLRLAVAGAVFFAVVVAAAAALVVDRRRRDSSAMLRALGATGRQQIAARVLEVAGALVIGAAIGVAAGIAVTWSTAGALARLADGTAPRGLPAVLHIDLPLVDVCGGALLIAVTAILIGTATGLARRAAP